MKQIGFLSVFTRKKRELKNHHFRELIDLREKVYNQSNKANPYKALIAENNVNMVIFYMLIYGVY